MILKYPLVFIVFLAIILRLPHLGSSFWMDEAAQALEIIRPLNQQLDIISDFQPPLLHFILHFAQYISINEWFLRIVGALIPGIITIIFTYKIAQTIFSKQTAILAGLLLATSSFHIFYSQELRPYSLPASIAVLSLYYFLQLIPYKTTTQQKIQSTIFSIKNFTFSKLTTLKNSISDNLIFLTIFNILGLYASYLYPFFMLSEIIYVLVTPKLKEKKHLLFSFVISILAFLPFLPLFLKQLAEGGTVRTQLPGWEEVVSVTQLKAIPLIFGKLFFGVLPLDLNPIILVLGLLFGGTLLFVTPTILKQYKKINTRIIIFWIILPVVSAWLISFIVPVIQPKRLLYILPVIYIVCAHIYIILQNAKVKMLAHLFIGSLLLINITGTVAYYINPHLQRENWRGLVTQLHNELDPTETLLIYSFPEPFAPMRWYEQFQTTPFQSLATKALYIESVDDLSNTLKIASSYKTVIVFDYLRDLTDPNKKIETVLLELGFKEVGVLDYPNIGFVRMYMQPLTVIGMN